MNLHGDVARHGGRRKLSNSSLTLTGKIMLKNQVSGIVKARMWHTVALATILAVPAIGMAQPMPPDHADHHPATMPTDMSLTDQVTELKAKVAKLEMTLQHKQMGMTGGSSGAMQPMGGKPQSPGGSMPGMSAAPGGGMGMGDDAMGGGKPPMDPMQGKSGMSGGGAMPAAATMAGGAPAGPAGGGMGMGMMQSEMGGMGAGAMPAGAPSQGMNGGGMGGGMGMDKMDMAGMMGMGAMSKGPNGSMSQSMLPGFPGASHIYHIGATGFFLDHPQHITLTTEQQAALNQAKEQATLAKSTADRAVEQADQELWMLTAADQPDAAKIEAKISEIEKLRGDERLGFIRAVGEASKVLTEEQRKVLTGFAPPVPAVAAPASAASPAPMSGM
jgi:Spy/CpxP family protein refolding chaperone